LDQIADCVTAWKTAVSQSNRIVLRDAEGEFGDRIALAFGIDGDAQVRHDDFLAVRGSFDQHAFVQQLKLEDAQVQQRAETLLARIDRLR
jgi:hypothetical protein